MQGDNADKNMQRVIAEIYTSNQDHIWDRVAENDIHKMEHKKGQDLQLESLDLL